MGMDIAFSSGAGFSGMTTAPCWIDDVFQETYIDVNEKGIPAEFSANRPFIFAIRKTSTNAVLFIGQKVR